MNITDFDTYRKIIKEVSGLVLTPDKTYLLESRLSPMAKKWGFASLGAMTSALRGVPEPELLDNIAEAMTNNETSFFHDPDMFDYFRDHCLPSIAQAREKQKKVRILSTATSSGQEAYSIAMIIKEMEEKYPRIAFEIVAFDLSSKALKRAEDGVYTQLEVQRGVPVTMLMQYFEQKGEKWRIRDQVKRMVSFKRFNLLESIEALGTFDIVFCCNVLAYFDDTTQSRVLDDIAEHLAPDGYLLLGDEEIAPKIPDILAEVPDTRHIYAHKNSPHTS